MDFLLFEAFRAPECGRSCVATCSCDGYTCVFPTQPFSLGTCTAAEAALRTCDPQPAPFPYACPPCMQAGSVDRTIYGYCDKFMTCGVPRTDDPECVGATHQCLYWSDHAEASARMCGANTDDRDATTHYDCQTYINTNPGNCEDDGRRRELEEEEERLGAAEEIHMEGMLALRNTTSKPSVLGFIRIPKTGSTTALQFLDRSRTMHSWDQHVDLSSVNTGNNNMAGCIVWHGRKSDLHEHATRKFWNRCPHVPFSKLVEFWAKTLPHWQPKLPSEEIQADSTAVQTIPTTADQVHSISLEAFTFVRDPFDRLVVSGQSDFCIAFHPNSCSVLPT